MNLYNKRKIIRREERLLKIVNEFDRVFVMACVNL